MPKLVKSRELFHPLGLAGLMLRISSSQSDGSGVGIDNPVNHFIEIIKRSLALGCFRLGLSDRAEGLGDDDRAAEV